MGGIVGAVGRTDIVAQLVEGMARIPYQAVDTCGLATVSFSSIDVRKDIGPLPAVSHKRDFHLAKGCIGIGHLGNLQSRNSRKNAQPHVSCDGKFAVVNDGMISNSEWLRANLATNGRHFFFSETGSEVFGHLMEEAFRVTPSVEEAFAEALRQIEGDFAVAVISSCESPRIFCAHHNRPLLIETDDQTTLVQSYVDSLKCSSNPQALREGEYAVLSAYGFSISKVSRRDKKQIGQNSFVPAP